MNVIGLELLDGFASLHPDVKSQLNNWYKVARRAAWKNIIEVRQTYPYADAVGTCTVFNIKGNHYRLITRIDYRAQTIFIKDVLTHAEYNKEKWKKGCGR